ncbi:hypothetical protein F8271_26870 [Micromonospora sp. ALFpr18c]|uniref:hypothetical protein n=1 Tax=unclassified Micromonospora TaxID=2617518 RepID=UPI00124B1EE5|nr:MULTISPECIES: hypothetical protein [unclassified Micromonospora]KAB1931707.1 hypothetical protein F8271_26870 [Micromonospora sp. ALFpr18c]MDG4761017.1 hypothetical protein [Micromonospora sp. WMMD710]
MAEPAKKVAQQTEERLEDLADTVREKFDKVTEGSFRDRIVEGRFADQTDHGVDQARAETERKRD